MTPGNFARRRLLALLGGVALDALTRPCPALSQVDQGIGGTGAAPIVKDQGIGGTGVIGTIRKFGSIVVNDLRIRYPDDVKVTLDGEPGAPKALKIGQVVRVVTKRDGDTFSTDSIAVSSEVVGKIERIDAKSMRVLGQTVSTADLPASSTWKVGDHVGVNGLRRNDGVIVASLLEARPDTINRVAGPLIKSADGTLMIGGLRLSGVAASLVGQRVEVAGRPTADRLEALQVRGERDLFGGGITRLSIEAYVARRGGKLELGSGLAVAGGTGKLRDGNSVRAVLVTNVDRTGVLRVQSLRPSSPRAEPSRPELERKGRGAADAIEHGRGEARGAGAKEHRRKGRHGADMKDRPVRQARPRPLDDLGSNQIGGQRPEVPRGPSSGRGGFGQGGQGGRGRGGGPRGPR